MWVGVSLTRQTNGRRYLQRRHVSSEIVFVVGRPLGTSRWLNRRAALYRPAVPCSAISSFRTCPSEEITFLTSPPPTFSCPPHVTSPYDDENQKVIIQVLGKFGLEGERESEHTGVWVGGAKVAAIGLNASRWVTSHGFALNVNPDLRAFDAIVPCGIQGRPVTRLCDLIGAEVGTPPPSPDEIEVAAVAEGRDPGAGVAAAAAAAALDAGSVRSLLVQEFGRAFDVEMEVVDVEVDVEESAVDGGGELERRIFSTECEPRLLERLKADSRRQLELKRGR